MTLKDLTGFTLIACRFSKSSYTLEIEGNYDGSMRRFSISTSYYLSKNSLNKKDSENEISNIIWSKLERVILSIIIDNDNENIIFKFDNNEELIFWGDAPLIDNLLLIHDLDSEKWFTVF